MTTTRPILLTLAMFACDATGGAHDPADASDATFGVAPAGGEEAHDRARDRRAGRSRTPSRPPPRWMPRSSPTPRSAPTA